jgi:hypothetical protein
MPYFEVPYRHEQRNDDDDDDQYDSDNCGADNNKSRHNAV